MILHWGNAIRGHYLAWLNAQRQSKLTVSHSELMIVWCIVAFFAVTAAFGYVFAGYHVGFLNLNEMGRFFNEPTLHLMTVMGVGLVLLPLMLLAAKRHLPLLIALLIAGIIGGIVASIGKNVFDALRPPVVLGDDAFRLVGIVYKHRSFPSGALAIQNSLSRRRFTTALLVR